MLFSLSTMKAFFHVNQCASKSWEQRKLAAGHLQSPGLCSKAPPLKGNLLTPGSHGADSESVSHLYHDGVENESWYHRHQQQSCAHQKHSREAVLVFLWLYNHQGKATRSDTPCCKDQWINVAVTRGKWDSGSPQETSTSQWEWAAASLAFGLNFIAKHIKRNVPIFYSFFPPAADSSNFHHHYPFLLSYKALHR